MPDSPKSTGNRQRLRRNTGPRAPIGNAQSAGSEFACGMGLPVGRSSPKAVGSALPASHLRLPAPSLRKTASAGCSHGVRLHPPARIAERRMAQGSKAVLHQSPKYSCIIPLYCGVFVGILRLFGPSEKFSAVSRAPRKIIRWWAKLVRAALSRHVGRG